MFAAFGTGFRIQVSGFRSELVGDGEEKTIPKSDFQSPHHIILYLSVTYKYFQQQSKKIFKRVCLVFLLQIENGREPMVQGSKFKVQGC